VEAGARLEKKIRKGVKFGCKTQELARMNDLDLVKQENKKKRHKANSSKLRVKINCGKRI
jgi:hypothetical protein